MADNIKKNLLAFEGMPANQQEAILRLHHRMQAWRTKHPKADVTIFWRDQEHVIVIAVIRDAIRAGLVHVNQNGWDMIRAMCEPEEHEPTLNMVRTAIELKV